MKLMDGRFHDCRQYCKADGVEVVSILAMAVAIQQGD